VVVLVRVGSCVRVQEHGRVAAYTCIRQTNEHGFVEVQLYAVCCCDEVNSSVVLPHSTVAKSAQSCIVCDGARSYSNKCLRLLPAGETKQVQGEVVFAARTQLRLFSDRTCLPLAKPSGNKDNANAKRAGARRARTAACFRRCMGLLSLLVQNSCASLPVPFPPTTTLHTRRRSGLTTYSPTFLHHSGLACTTLITTHVSKRQRRTIH